VGAARVVAVVVVVAVTLEPLFDSKVTLKVFAVHWANSARSLVLVTDSPLVKLVPVPFASVFHPAKE
jgi:hypothetical protein